MNTATSSQPIRGVKSTFVFDFASARTTTDEGYLTAPARIARVGVQAYRARELGLPGVDGDKEIRLYRPPEEVFDPQAMASFESKPLADDHPRDGISAANWKTTAVGDIRDVGADGKYLTAKVIIRDKGTIDKVIGGKTQLSCGYQFDADMTPGTTPDGQAYDGVQRRILGNHVAVVAAGRAGREVRIADGAPSRAVRGRGLFLHRGRFGGDSDPEPEPEPALMGRALFLNRPRGRGNP